MEEALVALLLAAAGVSAKVGTRIFWASRPQGTALPAITLTKVSGVPDYTNDGRSNLATARVQVDCEAETYLAGKTLARAVRDALDIVPTTISGCTLQGAFIDGERDLYEFDAETQEAGHPFGVSLDVIVHHTE